MLDPNFEPTPPVGISDPEEFLRWVDENLPRDVVTKHLIAGENLGSSMGIRVGTDGKAYRFDINDPPNYDSYLGISSQSTNAGNIIKVTTYGLAEPPGTWQAGSSYYIGSDSYLTDIAPGAGLVKIVALGVDGNRIVVVCPGGGSSSTGTTSDVLIDCGTITDPSGYVLIDCGTIL